MSFFFNENGISNNACFLQQLFAFEINASFFKLTLHCVIELLREGGREGQGGWGWDGLHASCDPGGGDGEGRGWGVGGEAF